MSESTLTSTDDRLTDINRHWLFEACTREALRHGGDERCAEYFFVRAQSSRVWISNRRTVTVADMAIEDWCTAIAWSAPGLGRPPKNANRKESRRLDFDNDTSDVSDVHERKRPRSGAQFRRPSSNIT